MPKKWIFTPVWMFIMLFMLSGCFFRSPEDLYQSPERSADYLSLTQTVQAVKNGLSQTYGVEVEDISVMSGSNTALIQLQDMDGDGERETAVTFFRVPETDRPLKIYFFTKSNGDTYVVSGVVEGSGSSIYRVDYVDLNGNGWKEIVVSWQMNTGAYLLGAYSLEEIMPQNVQYAAASSAAFEGTRPVPVPSQDALRAEEWMTTAYTDYVLYDLDQDARTEIAVIQVDPAGTNSKVELYGWQDKTFLAHDSVSLSAGIVNNGIRGVETNFLREDGDVPLRALYISSELADGRRVVDVVAYQEGQLTNLSLDETGVSQDLLDRYVDLEPTDVNRDGVLELPTPIPLDSDGTSSSDFWLIDWSQYNGQGEKSYVCTTYHNSADGWYLVIPEEWKNQIALSRYDAVTGQRAIFFYHLEESGAPEPTPFLVIYKFTSQFERAETSSRFLLREEEDAVYAASLYESEWDCGMNSADLQAAFHLIQSSWTD